MPKQCLLIFNPISGSESITSSLLLDRVKSRISTFDFTLWETTGEDDGDKIKAQFDAIQPELVVIAGGDGTVKLVANSLKGKEITLAIVPLGSANGLAKCLDIDDLDSALEAIDASTVHPIDGIYINGDLCLHLADFGINANLIRKFEREEKRGMMSYVKHSLSEIFGTETAKYQLLTGDKTIDIEAKMIVIANGDKYGTGAMINCGGLMDDGFFEVIALNPQTADDYIRMTVEFFNGKLHENVACESWRLQSCELVNLEKSVFQIDGEMHGRPGNVKVEIEKHAFRFVTGKSFSACQSSQNNDANLN